MCVGVHEGGRYSVRNTSEVLFCSNDLSDTLSANLEQAKKDVDQISEGRFLHSGDEEIIEHVFSKREVIPLTLHEDRTSVDRQETQVDVRHDRMRIVLDANRPCLVHGVRITVTVSFEGDPTLWHCRPNEFNLNPPSAYVSATQGECGGHIEIILEYPSDKAGDAEAIKKTIERILANIRWYLEIIRKDVEAHNQQLRNHIGQRVKQRRERLARHESIIKTLNIPLTRRPGAPDVAALPIHRRIVRPLPTAPGKPPEPGIREEEYAHILKVIRHEGLSFETTPQTFTKHDEEELRDIILAHLNGHYLGLATGETFRKGGKTDIRIEDQNRAAFVAECKVWRGETELANAIDQLLGYLTWRDCKGALIVFNFRNAKFAELQAKLPEVVKSHRLFLSEVYGQDSGEWRFRMRSLEDEDRIVTLHVFLFNLYTKA